jgi:hypothetical protein
MSSQGIPGRIARVLGMGVITASLVVTMSPLAWAGTTSMPGVERCGVQKVVGVRGQNANDSDAWITLEAPVGTVIRSEPTRHAIQKLTNRTSSGWKVWIKSSSGLNESASGSYCAPRMVS